jgi:hypothetical protein
METIFTLFPMEWKPFLPCYQWNGKHFYLVSNGMENILLCFLPPFFSCKTISLWFCFGMSESTESKDDISWVFNTHYGFRPVHEFNEQSILVAFGEGDIVRIRDTSTHFRIAMAMTCGINAECKLTECPIQHQDTQNADEQKLSRMLMDENHRIIDDAVDAFHVQYEHSPVTTVPFEAHYRVAVYDKGRTSNTLSNTIHVSECNQVITACRNKDPSIAKLYNPTAWELVSRALEGLSET